MAISVRGEHQHVCVNPSGIPFRIRCFREVTGVVPRGLPQDYWSWFAGYRWQIIVCSACMSHLGWAFLGGDDSFFGLIVTRIAEREQSSE
jgi:hypothetical protein